MKPKKTGLVLTVAMVCVLAVSLTACDVFKVVDYKDPEDVEIDRIIVAEEPVYTEKIDEDIYAAYKTLAEESATLIMGEEAEIPENGTDEAKGTIDMIKKFAQAARIDEPALKKLCTIIRDKAPGIFKTLEFTPASEEDPGGMFMTSFIGGEVTVKDGSAKDAVKLYKDVYLQVTEAVGNDAAGYCLYNIILMKKEQALASAEAAAETLEGVYIDKLAKHLLTEEATLTSEEQKQQLRDAFDKVVIDILENGSDDDRQKELNKLRYIQEKYSIDDPDRDRILESLSEWRSAKKWIDSIKKSIQAIKRIGEAPFIAVGRVAMRIADSTVAALEAEILTNKATAAQNAGFMKNAIRGINISDETWDRLIDKIVVLCENLSTAGGDSVVYGDPMQFIIDIALKLAGKFLGIMKGNINLLLDTAAQITDCLGEDEISHLTGGVVALLPLVMGMTQGGDPLEGMPVDGINAILAGMKITNKLVNVNKSKNLDKLADSILPKLDEMCKRECGNTDDVEKGPEADLKDVYAAIAELAKIPYQTEPLTSESEFFQAMDNLQKAVSAYIAFKAPYAYAALFEEPAEFDIP